MADDIFIKIKTLIEKASDADLQKTRKEIENKIGEVKVNVTPKIDKLKEFQNANKEIYKTVETITKELGVQEEITRKMGEHTGTVITTNYEKQRKEAEKMSQTMDKIMRQSESNSRARHREIELKQAQAINRALEDRYKLSQKLDSFKGRMLGIGELKGELDIFAEKSAGKYDESALAKLRADIEGLTDRTPDLSKRMKEASTSFSLLKQQASEAGSVLTRMLDNMFKFMRFYLVGGLLVKAVGQIREGINTVKSLDEALTNMSITMNLSSVDMNRMTQSAQGLAKELGATVNEVLTAAKTFANMNESMESILEKTRANIVLSNLSGLNIEETTDAIQGIINQFDLLQEDSMKIADSLTHISANMSMDFGKGIREMVDGIKVSGAMAREAGFDLERYMAILGKIIEQTRLSGSTISTGLRTIFARMGRASGDDVATEEDISRVEAAFKGVGIAVRDMNGEFRDVPVVLDELASKWGNLSKVQRSYIAEEAAGVRQKNIFLNLLDTLSDSTELYTDALNANGFAMDRNDVYMESIEGRTQKLTASLETFWQNFIDRDTIKDFISFLDTLITGFDKLINNSFASFIIQASTITGLILMLNKGFIALKNSTLGTTIAIYALDLAQGKLTFSTKTLTAALLASPLFKLFAVTAGVLLLVKGIDHLNSSFKRQEEAVQSLKSEINTLQSEYDSLSARDDLTDQQKVYLDLLEKEIESKQRSYIEDTKLLAQRKYFTPLGFTPDGQEYGSEASQLQIRIDKIEELKNKQLELNESSQEWQKIQGQIDEELGILQDAYKELFGYIESLGDHAPKELVDLFSSLESVLSTLNDEIDNGTDSAEASTVAIKQAAEEYKKAQNQFEQTTSTLQSLYKIQDELNNKNKLSASSIQEVISNHSSLLPYLNDEIALRKAIEDAIVSEEKVQAQAYRNMLANSESFFNATIQGNASLRSALATIYGEDLSQFRSLNQAKLELNARVVKVMGDSWARLYGTSISGLNKLMGEMIKFGIPVNDPRRREIMSLMSAMYEIEWAMDRAVKSASTSLGRVNLSGITSGAKSGAKSGGKSSSSQSKAMKEYVSQLEDFYNQLRKISQLEAELSALQQQRSLFHKESDILTSIKQEIILQRELLQLNKELNKIQINARKNIAKEMQGFGGAVSLSSDLETLNINTAKYNKLSDTQKEKLDGLIDEFDQLTLEIQGSNSAMLDAQISIRNLTEQTADEIVSIFKSSYEKQRDIAISTIDERMKAEEKAHQSKMDMLDKELSKYEEAINAQLKLIDAQADEEDWNKQLTKEQEKLLDLERQRNLLAMDDSLEARAKVSDLDKQIAEQKEHIDDMQVNRERELRKQNLNDQLESYRQDVEAKRKAEQSKFEALQLELEQEREAIQYHYDELLANEQFYADLREDIINGNLSNIQSSLASFLADFKNANEQTIKDLGLSWQELLNLIGAVESAQGSLGAIKGGTTAPIKTTPPPSSPAPSGGGSGGGSSAKYYTVKSGDNLTVVAKRLGTTVAKLYAENKAMIDAENKRRGVAVSRKWLYPKQKLKYHQGGIVGDYVGGDAEILNSLLNTKMNEQAVVALKREVMSPEHNFMKYAIPNLQKLVASFSPQLTTAGAGSKTINLNVNVAKLNLNDKKQMNNFYRDLQSSVKTLLK